MSTKLKSGTVVGHLSDPLATGTCYVFTESVPENTLTRAEYLAVCKLTDSLHWCIDLSDKDKDTAADGINKLLRGYNEESS